MSERRAFQRVPEPADGRERAHVGESLAVVVLRDPAWYFFAEQFFSSWGLHEHREISAKARSILFEPGYAVVYEGLAFGTVCGTRLAEVEADAAASDAFDVVRPTLDLSLVATAKGRRRERALSKRMTRFFKRHVLGNSRARITTKRAEEFFADDSNFAARPKTHLGGWTRVGLKKGRWPPRGGA